MAYDNAEAANVQTEAKAESKLSAAEVLAWLHANRNLAGILTVKVVKEIAQKAAAAPAKTYEQAAEKARMIAIGATFKEIEVALKFNRVDEIGKSPVLIDLSRDLVTLSDLVPSNIRGLAGVLDEIDNAKASSTH